MPFALARKRDDFDENVPRKIYRTGKNGANLLPGVPRLHAESKSSPPLGKTFRRASSRAFSENKKRMHEEMTKMAAHIHKLKVAIATLHAEISDDTHPLLLKVQDDEVPDLEVDVSVFHAGSTNSLYTSDLVDDLAEMLGMTLKINPYHEGTATAEHLIKMDLGLQKRQVPDDANLIDSLTRPLSLEADVFFHAHLFPFPPEDEPPLEMDAFLPYLPTCGQDRVMMECYLSYFTWAAMPVPKADLERIYGRFYADGVPTGFLHRSEAHALAVLFMVFAIGTVFDVSLDSAELAVRSKEFYLVARAAMAADPVEKNTTLHGVQAIILMIWFLRFSPSMKGSSFGFQSALLGVLSKLTQAIGLHRDKSVRIPLLEGRLEHIPLASERLAHQQTFWEFLTADIWQSTMLGRPASVCMSDVDCPIPEVVDAPECFAASHYPWKCSFSRCMSKVMARVRGTPAVEMEPGTTHAVQLRYEEIIELEHQIQDHYVPDDLAWPAADEPLGQEAPGKTYQRWVTYMWPKIAIMYIHKGYFNYAVMKHSYDPTKSPTWRSVEIVYDTAVLTVTSIIRLWREAPTIISRMASFWSHVQSVATILATLVTRSPGCKLAGPALYHLDKAMELFLAGEDAVQPRKSRGHLLDIQARARQTYNVYHDTSSQFHMTVDPIPSAEWEDRYYSVP